jgi:DNA-binding transcriptional MerR regulator
MATSTPDDLLTSSAAGRILGLSPDMVRILNDKGLLPALKTVNGYRLFRREDVERLKAERQVREDRRRRR